MTKKYIITITALLLICILFFIKNNKNNEIYVDDIYISDENVVKEEKEIINTIKIHIYGQVNKPGLIELNAGDRVLDAIEVAEGMTSEADITKVNLAYILSDGEKIYIPSVNDEMEQEETTISSNKININIASKEEIQTLSGIGEALAESIIEYRKNNGKFDSIDELKNVSGIGDSKFEKIKDNISIK